jgi:hypothetical protein
MPRRNSIEHGSPLPMNLRPDGDTSAVITGGDLD